MAVIDRARRSDSTAAAALGRSRRAWAAPAAVGATVAVVDLIGAGNPSYWGDEAASVMSAQRDLPSLARELSAVDAVHGIYYTVLHFWIGAFGAGEWATRTLSVLATGLLAAGVVVLATRWTDRRTAVLAGLLVAIIPRSSALAIEARGYAITEALAVWIVVVFVWMLEGRAARSRWIVFGVGCGTASWFFLYLLLVPLTLFALALLAPAVLSARSDHRARPRDVIAATAAALIAALPILVFAALQRHQVGFLAHRDYLTPAGVLVTPWFAKSWIAVVFWTLITICVVFAVRTRGSARWVVVAASWLLVPAVALIALDVFVAPTYDPRYLAISIGAVAILAAQGITALLVWGGRGARRHAVAAVTVAMVVTGVTVPQYLHQRTAYAKDGGADFRSVAETIRHRAHVGDVVLFGDGPRPSRTARLTYRLYPDAFAGLQDPQLVTAFDQRAGLWDELAEVPEVAPRLDERDVWLIESTGAHTASRDVRALRRAGYRPAGEHRLHRTTIYEFTWGVHHE